VGWVLSEIDKLELHKQVGSYPLSCYDNVGSNQWIHRQQLAYDTNRCIHRQQFTCQTFLRHLCCSILRVGIFISISCHHLCQCDTIGNLQHLFTGSSDISKN